MTTKVKPRRQLDNYGQPRLKFALKVWLMSDTDLMKETAEAIYWSAWANSNPRSDYHWHVDVFYDELVRRDMGHRYEEAFKAAKRKAGLC